MRVLVTGGAGFIGCNFVRFLLQKYPDDEIIVLDKLTYAGRLENLEEIRNRITFIRGDICRPADIRKAGPCDSIVNFAAETHVDRSIGDPEIFVRTDVLGSHNLLSYARKHDVGRYVQISTDEVYGSISEGSFCEDDALDPSSPYSASKAAADHLVRSYFKTYGLPVLITRSSNNFGPFQYPEKLIPVLILKAMAGGQLPIYGTGENIRDWIYVEDNCSGIDAVFSRGVPGEIYNIGAGNEVSNLAIAHMILNYWKKSTDLISFVRDRPGHDLRYSVNTGKIRGLGWAPRFRLADALYRTIRWYESHTAWWQPLLAPVSLRKKGHHRKRTLPGKKV